jgi:hypothetical protein
MWVVAALAALTVAGVAVAQGTRSDTIRACYAKKSGSLRVLAKPSAKCRRSERALSWSQRGPAGEPGAPGATGAAGAGGTPGANGPTGPAGADGADGQRGPTGPAGADGADGQRGPTGPTGIAGAPGPGAGFGFRGSLLGNTPLPVNTATPAPGTMEIDAKADGIVLIDATVLVAAGASATRVVCSIVQANGAGEDPFDQFFSRNFLVTLVANESKTWPIKAEGRTSGGTTADPRDHRIGVSCNPTDAAATFRESYIHASLLGE